MTPSEFLQLIWGETPPGRVLIWTPFRKTSSWYSSFETVDEDIERLGGWDVYMGVGCAPSSGVPLETHRRLPEKHIKAIPGLWSDVNVAHPVHTKADQLPPTVEIATEIIEEDAPGAHSSHRQRAWASVLVAGLQTVGVCGHAGVGGGPEVIPMVELASPENLRGKRVCGRLGLRPNATHALARHNELQGP